MVSNGRSAMGAVDRGSRPRVINWPGCTRHRGPSWMVNTQTGGYRARAGASYELCCRKDWWGPVTPVIYPAKHASNCMHASPQTITLRSHSTRCNWIIGDACAALLAIHYARPQIREFVIDRRFSPRLRKSCRARYCGCLPTFLMDGRLLIGVHP